MFLVCVILLLHTGGKMAKKKSAFTNNPSPELKKSVVQKVSQMDEENKNNEIVEIQKLETNVEEAFVITKEQEDKLNQLRMKTMIKGIEMKKNSVEYKKKKQQNITVRVSFDMQEKIKELADVMSVSQSGLITLLVENFIKENGDLTTGSD